MGAVNNAGMSEIIPVLELGKARAKEAFLAGSGRVINPSRNADTRQVRYRMGRHRGKTPDQVDSEFERLWGSVNPKVREKYAKMAGPQTSSGYGAKVEKPEMKKVPLAPVPRPEAKPDAAKVPTVDDLTKVDHSALTPDGMRHSIGDGAASAPVSLPKMPDAVTGTPEEWKAYNDQMAKLNPSTPFLKTPMGKLVAPIVDPDTIHNTDSAGNRIDKPGSVKPTAATPVATVEKPGAFAGAKRRGGASPSAQQGRISSGASPSAPPAVRDAAADVADKPWQNVAGQPAQTPVPRPMPDQKTSSVTPAERARPTMSETPAGMELVGMKGGVPQYESIGSVYGESPRKADAPPLGNVGPVRAERTANDIRADYQNRNQTPANRAGADNAMRSQGMVIPATPQTPVTRGPASQPAPAYQSPTEKGGAFSRERYAKTAAAQQEGWDKKAIRDGTASQATKDKWSDYSKEREAGVAMDKEINKGKPYGGAAPVVGGVGSTPNSKVVGIRPGSAFPIRKPRFAMAR